MIGESGSEPGYTGWPGWPGFLVHNSPSPTHRPLFLIAVLENFMSAPGNFIAAVEIPNVTLENLIAELEKFIAALEKFFAVSENSIATLEKFIAALEKFLAELENIMDAMEISQPWNADFFTNWKLFGKDFRILMITT